jgi:hypothetical protein
VPIFDKLKQRWGAESKAGDPSADPTLAQRLADYPPYQAPHAGRRKQLSVEAARENLAYFQSALPQRLQHVGALLRADAEIDIGPALAAPQEQGVALAEALNVWASRRWPALHEPRLATIDAWMSSRRQGPDIVWSLVMDVAVLLGELICRANADWRWGLDLAPLNLKDKMLSARRIVLLADPVGEMLGPFVKDVEDRVAGRLMQIDHANDHDTRMNPWRRLVDDGQRGADMAYYRARPQVSKLP